MHKQGKGNPSGFISHEVITPGSFNMYKQLFHVLFYLAGTMYFALREKLQHYLQSTCNNNTTSLQCDEEHLESCHNALNSCVRLGITIITGPWMKNFQMEKLT